MGEWTRVTLKIWKAVQTAFNLPKQISSAGSIGYLKGFVPAHMNADFKKWSEYGLCYVYQLIHNGELKSFKQLRQEFTLPRTDFFRYLQLRHFLTTHKEWEKVKNLSLIEVLFFFKLQAGNEVGKVISKLYSTFLLMIPNNTIQTKEKWEAEMNADISLDTWTEICREAHQMTNGNIWRELRWKVIMRYFRTPQITAKWVLASSDKCWRNCGPQSGNHTHIFWSCPKLSTFWKEVLDALREVFHQNIPNDPRVVLLGSIPEGFEGRAKIYLLQILLGAAIKCLTIRWLKLERPKYNIWL